jgi:glutamine synthetase
MARERQEAAARPRARPRTPAAHVVVAVQVRSLAEQKGLRATFMPKPFANLTGSGCHAHLSLHDVGTGKNVCGGGASDVHGLSPTALSFM